MVGGISSCLIPRILGNQDETNILVDGELPPQCAKTFNVTSIVECIGHLQVEEELGSTFLGVEKRKFKVEMKIACPKKLMIKVVLKNNYLQFYFQSSHNAKNSKLIIATQNITSFSRSNPIVALICLWVLPTFPSVWFENNVEEVNFIHDFESDEELESKDNGAKKNYETTHKFQDS